MSQAEFELLTRVCSDGLVVGAVVGIIATTFRMFFNHSERR